MASEDSSSHNLAESGITMHSDSEQYSPGEELSTSPPSSSSPVILYKPPTVWSLIRGAAINLLLPFINGMMLGFGELFAHEAAFRLGWGGTKQTPPSALSQRIHNGRQLSTIVGSSRSSPLRSRTLVAPIALGGMASSSRAFSLWGWGWSGKKEAAPVEAPAATTTTTSASASDAAVRPVDPTPENAIPTPPTEPAVAASDMELPASIADMVNGQDILNMPEQLGYLHAMGLDYGWGPTSVMQWVLEHVHVWTGLGWGASVMATAVLLRLLMFYPQVRSLQFNGVMQRMRKDPRAQEAMKLIQQGFQERDMEMRQKGQYLNKMLKEQYGASNWGMLWSFMQIPFTFGLFRIVSGMTHIPVPSLETAGYLWFQDLTATDPYFVLPALGTGLMISALALNAKYTPEAQRKMLKNMTYVFGVVGFIGTTFLSSAVNLMTVALGASTLLQSIILNIPAVRSVFNLPPAPVDAPKTVTYEAPRGGAAAPTGGLRERLTTNLDDMKKGFSEQVTNYTGQYQGTEAEKAERKRKDLMRKLEDTRKQQERDEFEKKYKGRR
ncbi:OXA1-like protein [Purpureocillium lavendulum]|uniref:OXA1-like protein n=1 Tax=Purpureocillium lavendulum TaxID=1247861 RepID=A0AB34FIT0_9HYPO|nr:OXA1-like protein [Purpureocillium lavendulum]